MDDNQIKAALLESMKQQNPQASTGAFVHLQHLTQEDTYLFTILTKNQGGQKIVNPDALVVFKQIYKPITIFAQEQTYHENGTVSFGQQPNIECRLTGELVNSAYFTCTLRELNISNIANTGNQNRKIAYISNVGFSMMSALIDLGIPADCVNSSQNLILQNIMKRYDQRLYINQMQQNIPQNTRLTQVLPQIKIIVPLSLFFNGKPERALRNYQGNISKLIFEIKTRNIDQLFCYTQNLSEFIENNSSFIQNYQTMQKAGIVLNEIFVSDSERNAMLEPINGDTSISEQKILFEQNLMTKRQINEKQQEISLNTFNHPSKMIYYYVQKKKFTSKLPYLYYEPYIEGYDFTQNLLLKATQRFVLKFSKYQIEKGGATFTNNEEGSTFIPKFTYRILNKSIYDTNETLYYSNQNKILIDVNQIYKSLGVSFINDQNFTTSNILLLNRTLNIEEASIPIDNKQIITITQYYKSTLPQEINFLSSDILANISQFSLYSHGPVQFGGSNDKSANIVAQTEIFSQDMLHSRYNEGIDSEDIIVNQWDNFGKNLDGSGEIILTSELHNSGLLRYKLNYNYTKNMHPLNYFPGKAPNGVHFYSFALNPESIQPSGTLSFTKQDLKLIIDCNADVGDILNVGTKVYNFITLKNGVFSIEYNSNIILHQFEI